jgi:hypothetical protein
MIPDDPRKICAALRLSPSSTASVKICDLENCFLLDCNTCKFINENISV